ncbi:MAG: MFS transporter, partial [Alphaproteobacteria bacterium]|nr:MFS transporter [Alphaproteobacteria bacterium]
MLDVLRQATFVRLFTAQVVALLGTGLLTVALGLLAYQLAGERAGVVLGTALAIKMIAYVTLAPIASALIGNLSRKWVLIAMDVIRAAIALALPFIDAIWQIYVCIFLLQAASATFTPTFQALIPDILPDENDYTEALSLSRLAYDLESLISPAVAGLLLLFVSFHWLFAGTAVGFALSASMIAKARLPEHRTSQKERRFVDRLTRGARIYLATPRLRGLLCLNLAAAAGGGMVIVNTVVIVRSGYRGSESDVATAMAAFGFGSMLAALTLPRLLDRLRDRSVMVSAAAAMTIILLLTGVMSQQDLAASWTTLLSIWFALGLGYSMVLTPAGRLLRRSAHDEDRPAVFAAQFALSHACWLLTYPLAGWAGHAFGMGPAMILLGAVALLGVVAASRLWPANDPDVV